MRHVTFHREIVAIQAFGYQLDWRRQHWRPFSIRMGWRQDYPSLSLGRFGEVCFGPLYGNDGLTDRERRRLARKWRRGAGKAPSAATIRAHHEAARARRKP